MEYRYKCDTKPIDLFKISINRTYHSVAGVVNVVFTLAMVALCIRFFGETNAFFRGLIILGCIWFPLIQPLAIYGQSVKQLENQPRDTELFFNDQGVIVISGGQSERLPWKRIVRISKQPGAIVIMTDASHGYMISNRVLQDERDSFYQYLRDKLTQNTQ